MIKAFFQILDRVKKYFYKYFTTFLLKITATLSIIFISFLTVNALENIFEMLII